MSQISWIPASGLLCIALISQLPATEFGACRKQRSVPPHRHGFDQLDYNLSGAGAVVSTTCESDVLKWSAQ
jgi:hypothetical protein